MVGEGAKAKARNIILSISLAGCNDVLGFGGKVWLNQSMN